MKDQSRRAAVCKKQSIGSSCVGHSQKKSPPFGSKRLEFRNLDTFSKVSRSLWRIVDLQINKWPPNGELHLNYQKIRKFRIYHLLNGCSSMNEMILSNGMSGAFKVLETFNLKFNLDCRYTTESTGLHKDHSISFSY